MDTATLLLAVAIAGVNFGWQPAEDGTAGYEYIVQVEPELLDAVRRYPEGGAWLPEDFRAKLISALSHYGVDGLAPTDALERALLRLLASQAAPELRRRLVLGCLARVHALAGSGIHLGDDRRLDVGLERIAALRGLVTDALADLSLEARYAIFEGPRLESQAERVHSSVARRADSRFAVSGQQFSQCRLSISELLGRIFEIRHTVRRRSRWSSQDIIQNKQPALDRRSPRWIGSDQQH